jgi:hypothetical protein
LSCPRWLAQSQECGIEQILLDSFEASQVKIGAI